MKTATVKCPLVPLGDLVIIQRVDADSVTPGGIVLPDNAKEKPKKGVVLAVGPGKLVEAPSEYAEDRDDNLAPGRRLPMDVNVGDTVYFTAYAGNEIEVLRETYLVMRSADVLCKALVD